MLAGSDVAHSVGIVGVGVMGEALLSALLDRGTPRESIVVSHRRAERVADLWARYGVAASVDNAATAHADLVVLAVKPQTVWKVAHDLRGQLGANSTVVSLVAGVRADDLAMALEHAAVVRAMPNLPARIRRGFTVWYASAAVPITARDAVADLLGALGTHWPVVDEADIDRATAISGTGPAIVAFFVKAMLEAANYVGAPRDLGRQAVLTTLRGTLELWVAEDGHLAELIDEVASPGGTTSRALQTLKNGRFSAVLTEAVAAAHERAKEMGVKT